MYLTVWCYLYFLSVGVARNQTAAKELFETALELEAPSTTSAEYADQELLLEEGDGAFGDMYGDPLLGEGGALDGVLEGGGEVVAAQGLGQAGNFLCVVGVNVGRCVL